MDFYDIINDSTTVASLLNDLVKIESSWYKKETNNFEKLSELELNMAFEKIQELLDFSKSNKCKLLIRGESKGNLENKLKSDVSTTFSLGDKALNYKKNIERSYFSKINSTDSETMNWIFDEYSNISKGYEQFSNYFHDPRNKDDFINKLTGNEQLRDYYLFGLQTESSKRKVFFVSSSSSPTRALYKQSNKLLILFWVPEPHALYAQSKFTLAQQKKKIKELDLPVLHDGYYPEEKEFSIKGAIFPEYIYALIDVEENKVIINPKILTAKSDWILNGFENDKNEFINNLKISQYNNFVIRFGNGKYVD